MIIDMGNLSSTKIPSYLSRSEHVSPAIWLLMYFAANLILTIHNKWVLNTLNFNFPWILTALHISVSGIGAYLLLGYVYNARPTTIDRSAWLKLLLFSVLYSVNIAISNVSLSYVSLAFHQLVRSATPAFTVLIEYLFFSKTHSARIYTSLIPVVFGITLATAEEFSNVSFTLIGFLLTIFGVLLSCMKGIVTNILMVGPLKLHPLEVIWRMSIPSVIQCLLLGTYFGETAKIPDFFYSKSNEIFDHPSLAKLGANSLLALWLNWVSFTANEKTSALTMTVAGNVKQALSIILAIYIFNTHVTLTNIFGISIALTGGAWYSYEMLMEKNQSKSALSTKLQYTSVHSRSGSYTSP